MNEDTILKDSSSFLEHILKFYGPKRCYEVAVDIFKSPSIISKQVFMDYILKDYPSLKEEIEIELASQEPPLTDVGAMELLHMVMRRHSRPVYCGPFTSTIRIEDVI